MRKENEMKFVDSTDDDQNYSPVSSNSSGDGKLANVKLVRIRLDRKCALNECKTDKPYFQINSISTIDDDNPQNENEQRLFDAELAIPRFCPRPPQFNFYDTQTKQPYSLCRFDGYPIKHYGCCCFGESYEEFPNMITNLLSNVMDTSTTKCYDSRSFYRTFEYQGKPYYKIGRPYVKDERCCCEKYCICCQKKPEGEGCCQNCCQKPEGEGCCQNCCQNPEGEGCCQEFCQICCKKEKIERLYVNILNMSDQVVGQYACFFDQTGCCCCEKTTEFYEVYFPSDANEILKAALVGHFLFILTIEMNIFTPGSGKQGDFSAFAQ